MYLTVFLLLINAGSFLIMCLDKLLAKKHFRRVPERTLLLLAAFGGSFGCLLAMLLVRHKIRKPKFYITVPFFVALHTLLLCLAEQHGLFG